MTLLFILTLWKLIRQKLPGYCQITLFVTCLKKRFIYFLMAFTLFREAIWNSFFRQRYQNTIHICDSSTFFPPCVERIFPFTYFFKLNFLADYIYIPICTLMYLFPRLILFFPISLSIIYIRWKVRICWSWLNNGNGNFAYSERIPYHSDVNLKCRGKFFIFLNLNFSIVETLSAKCFPFF